MGEPHREAAAEVGGGVTVIPPRPKLTVEPIALAPGDKAKLCYSDPDRAGELVTVEIDNGRRPPTTAFVPIELDENGEGCAEWTVPTGWHTASFNAPEAHEVVRIINWDAGELGPGDGTEVAAAIPSASR